MTDNIAACAPDEPMPFVDIEVGYETVAANCPHCSVRNVYSRRSDLENTRLIANASVVCDGCGKSYSIGGDLVNNGYEVLLLDCKELFDAKRYADVVVVAVRSWEMFFSHFVHVQLLWRPMGLACGPDLDPWNDLAAKLDRHLKGFSFDRMRALFFEVVLAGPAPAILVEAQARIAALSKNPTLVSRPGIERGSSGRLKELLLAVHETKVHELRNRVGHKDAYRPTREEAWAAYLEVWHTLLGLVHELHLEGDEEFYINGGDRDWTMAAAGANP